MNIKTGWMTWDELLPYKEQLIDLELELMVKYHYPDWNIPRSYPEQRVNNLQDYLANGSTFIWTAVEGEKLLGYYWAYISQFIDKKRWNLRSIMFIDEAKGKGFGSASIQAGLLKAIEMNCDEAATEYAPWNKIMASVMSKFGYIKTRIEVVKDLSSFK